MWNKVNTFLNCVIGAFTGVFIAESIWTYRDYRIHPQIYAVMSAPWYTSVLLFGIITAVIVLTAVMIKFLIRKKVSRGPGKKGSR